jgi:hypothetical protein
MPDLFENPVTDETPLAEAAARLDAALARLEQGLGALAAKATRGEAVQSGDSAREAALEAALKDASSTMGALITEVRDAIQAAEEAADGER